MSKNTLFNVISLPIIIILSLITILLAFYLFIKSDNLTRLNKTNIMFLEFDLKQWRIKKKNIIWNKLIQKTNIDNKINSLFENGWIDINKFFTLFSEEDIRKWKSSIQFCVQNKTQTKVNLNIELGKNEKSNWNATIIYISENIFSINIRWTNTNIKKNKIKMIDKNYLFNINNKQYKLFLAFNLIDGNDINEFLNKISTIFKSKKIINYFIFKKVIVFVYEFSKFDEMQKARIKFDQLISKNENKLIINSFVDAISYIDAQEIKNENEFVKILTRISFGISKSKLTYKPFYFSIKNIHFNEFEEYKETINKLNDIIKNKSFDINENEIQSLGLNKNYSSILIPNTNIVIDKKNWFPLIINTTSFNEKIRTILLEQELNKSSNDDKRNPIILDINDYDINKNFQKIISNNHITYIINIVEYKKPLQLIELLDLLSKNKVKYGLRINKITSSTFSIVENSTPNIIIFSEKISKQFKINNFNKNIQYIGLLLICERLSIIPIFENINDSVKLNIQNIGKADKYYYSTTNA